LLVIAEESVNSRKLPGFVVVGAIGFLIDAGILTLLMTGFGLDHYSARALSFTVAVTFTWYMNRRWVFEKSTASMSGREYSSYLVVQVIGALINLSVFVAVIEFVPRLANMPVIPLAVGAIAALLFNFNASSRFVFSKSQDSKTESGGPEQ
jgi:putative flippase GtrA